MQLKVDRSPGAEWVQLIERFDGNIYHSQEWAETWRSDYAEPLYFRGLDEQGRCIGIALANERHSSRPVIGRFLRRLDFETFPAVQANDPDLARAMMDRIVEFARAGGISRSHAAVALFRCAALESGPSWACCHAEN